MEKSMEELLTDTNDPAGVLVKRLNDKEGMQSRLQFKEVLGDETATEKIVAFCSNLTLREIRAPGRKTLKSTHF